MCHKQQEEIKCSLTGARSIRGNYSRRSHFLAEVSYGPACFHLWFMQHTHTLTALKDPNVQTKSVSQLKPEGN